MRATIITIGDEILIGQVTDTNATYMAAALSEEGITVVEHISVADSRMGIIGGLERAVQQSELVLMTGGLGPTKDDITKQVLADYFGAELRLHNPTWKRLQKIFSRYGRTATEAHKQQCRLPTGAKVLTNEHGTAPGLWLEKDDQVVVSLPGVPYEMVYLMDNEVMRRLKRRQYDADILRHVTVLTAGAGESDIAEKLEEIEDSLPEHMGLAYLPNLGTVRLRISARGDNEAELQEQLGAFRGAVEEALGDLVFGYGSDDLAAVVGRRLQQLGRTVVTAESCTGGALGRELTVHPGSSKHFLGGIIAYSNAVKEQQLGVRAETLEQHGAVSEATVREMAEGARQRLGADYALATTGIAGPTGGTPEKPVGTIWMACAGPRGTTAKLLRSGKDRRRNITFTCLQALNLLRLELGVVPTPPQQPTPEPEPKKRTVRKTTTRKTTSKKKNQKVAASTPEKVRRKATTKPTELTRSEDKASTGKGTRSRKPASATDEAPAPARKATPKRRGRPKRKS